jgi:hypothetical protein
MRNEIVAIVNGRPVVAMDSISLILPENAGAIIVCGSHGGAISGAFAAKHPPALVVFNDAGGGRNDAGFTSLADLEREGIAAAAVSHDSARIGDALDAWENGVVSRVNALATEGGVLPGRSLREELQRFTPQERTPP